MATCAKPLALELPKYRLEYRDLPKEVMPQFVAREPMTAATKKIGKMGMEARLAVIQQVEIVEADKEIKKP